jgi:hypothetical protein
MNRPLKYLYHGSDAGFNIIQPQKQSFQNAEHGERVYATPNLAFASIFTYPRKHKIFQGFSGKVKTNNRNEIYSILPQNILLDEANTANLEQLMQVHPEIVFEDALTSQQKAIKIIQLLNDFHAIIKQNPVYIYTVSAEQFQPANHNSDLEFFSTNPAPIIPNLTKRYPCAMNALAENNVSLYLIDFPKFLQMRADATNEIRQSEHRIEVFRSKKYDLSEYRINRPESEVRTMGKIS